MDRGGNRECVVVLIQELQERPRTGADADAGAHSTGPAEAAGCAPGSGSNAQRHSAHPATRLSPPSTQSSSGPLSAAVLFHILSPKREAAGTHPRSASHRSILGGVTTSTVRLAPPSAFKLCGKDARLCARRGSGMLYQGQARPSFARLKLSATENNFTAAARASESPRESSASNRPSAAHTPSAAVPAEGT